MGSADLMQRNLDHRIEMVVPVEAPHVRAEIETIFRRLLERQLAGLDARQPTAAGSASRPSRASAGAPPRRVAMRGRARARRQSAPH